MSIIFGPPSIYLSPTGRNEQRRVEAIIWLKCWSWFIENDHGAKLQALFDVREAQNDINKRVFEALDRIEGKVDHLTLKIFAHEAILKKVK